DQDADVGVRVELHHRGKARDAAAVGILQPAELLELDESVAAARHPGMEPVVIEVGEVGEGPRAQHGAAIERAAVEQHPQVAGMSAPVASTPPTPMSPSRLSQYSHSSTAPGPWTV